MAQITMKEMLDAGVHFGHQTHRWNPKMKPYVYSARGGIHIIDLQKSVIRAKQAADYVKEVAASGGRMIFVGTKKQAVQPIQEAAAACNQYHVTKRWLGGMLTNFTTIKTSIDRLKKIERMREKNELDFFSKKERSKIEKEYTRLCDYLDGIKDMKESPAAIFVVDLNKEHIAVAEAKKLGMKVIGIADSNTDPGMIDFPIPGNDDAIRSIKLFSNMIADSYNEGAKVWAERRVVLEKESKDNAKRQTTEKSNDKKDASGDGPAVFKKASKGRKFIAAGTAEDVEIELELSKKASAIVDQPEAETAAVASKDAETTKDSKDS